MKVRLVSKSGMCLGAFLWPLLVAGPSGILHLKWPSKPILPNVLFEGTAMISGLSTSPIQFPGFHKKTTFLSEGRFASLLGIS